jgi:hypothetical protein
VDDPLERLKACGELELGAGGLADLPEPLMLPAGAETPSSVLARMRRDER